MTLTLQSDERRARIGLGLALIAGGVAHYPSLHAVPVIDDHFHAAWLEGSAAVHRPVWDLYRWVSAGEVERLVDAGHVPWWSDPRLRIGVFRPISSVSRWLDHVALHDNNFLAHLHSALWWSILLVLFWWGLRGSVSGMRRGVATILISLSPTLLVPIRWLADRNALISFVFLAAAWGVSTQRPAGHRSLATVAALAALAALGGEIAWSALPALAALHALRFHDARRTARFVSAAAAGLTGVLLISRALGYGIHHSGIYLDPFTQPGEFLRQFPLRMLLMLSRLPASALGALFPNAGAMAEFLALPIYLLALAAPLALLPGRRTRGLLLLATFASLLPVLPAVPSLRLLFGHHLALVMLALWPPPQAASRVRQALAGAPLALLLLGSALATPRETWHRLTPPARVTSLASLGVDADARVLLVSTSNFEVFQHPDVIRRTEHSPVEWLVACSARAPVLLTRDSAHTLSLRSTIPLLHPADLYRSQHAPLREGDTFRIGSVTITVRSTTEGRPTWLLLDFGHDLDARPWVLLQANGLELRRVPLLPIGASIIASFG